VGPSTRRTGSIPFGNHQYALPRLVSRLVGIRCIPRTPAAHRSGRVQQRTRQSAARCAEATEEQLAVAIAATRIHSNRFAPPRPVWRSNWIASGSQACHENGVPTPVTTDYRNLCRIHDKTAEKPAIGSALALPRNRCRLYGPGALGSPAFLDEQCGLSKTLARRFVSHCRSFIRSGNHLPRPYVRKNK
jgi:hypothetical protein